MLFLALEESCGPYGWGPPTGARIAILPLRRKTHTARWRYSLRINWLSFWNRLAQKAWHRYVQENSVLSDTVFYRAPAYW